MKALAMSQPWAELLVSGRKSIEVRTKNTSHRGWFYVYAAKKDTKEEVLRAFGFSQLPTGVIIGKAFLRDVKKYQDEKSFYGESHLHLATPEVLALEGWSLKTKYGYLVSDTVRMDPVPYRGLPGFFEIQL